MEISKNDVPAAVYERPLGKAENANVQVVYGCTPVEFDLCRSGDPHYNSNDCLCTGAVLSGWCGFIPLCLCPWRCYPEGCRATLNGFWSCVCCNCCVKEDRVYLYTVVLSKTTNDAKCWKTVPWGSRGPWYRNSELAVAMLNSDAHSKLTFQVMTTVYTSNYDLIKNKWDAALRDVPRFLGESVSTVKIEVAVPPPSVSKDIVAQPRFCPHCGTARPNSTQFCANCGRSFDTH